MPTLADIVRVLETVAPPGAQASWDNSGWQVGDPAEAATGVVVALDVTHAVVDEAVARGANLIVTHHPLVFPKLTRVVAGAGPSGLAYRLARAGVAHYALHTNLDASPGGVSFALAERLGLRDVRVLHPLTESLFKLVTFAPPSHAAAVREALARAGAGEIGRYTDCAFSSEGTGAFRPEAGADPFTGTVAGMLETAPEVRVEVQLPRWSLARVVEALRAAHPYEEVAYDVYPVVQPETRYGYGALGTLPEAMPREAFLAHVCERLETSAVRATEAAGPIHTVAVCGGSGHDFLPDALRARADAYVTADVTYHRFFDALGADGRPRLLYVDAGHFETERHTEAMIVRLLQTAHPALGVHRTATRTTPAAPFVRPA